MLSTLVNQMDAAEARAEATKPPCILTLQSDFAALMEVLQSETQCAQHPLTHHLYVVCASWGARRVAIPDMVRKAFNTENRSKSHALIRDTLAAFIYSEHPQNVRGRVFVLCGGRACVRACRFRVEGTAL